MTKLGIRIRNKIYQMALFVFGLGHFGNQHFPFELPKNLWICKSNYFKEKFENNGQANWNHESSEANRNKVSLFK